LSILVLGRARRIRGRHCNLRPAVGFTAAPPKQHEPRKESVLDLGGKQAQARRQSTLLPAGGLSMTISELTVTLDQAHRDEKDSPCDFHELPRLMRPSRWAIPEMTCCLSPYYSTAHRGHGRASIAEMTRLRRGRSLGLVKGRDLSSNFARPSRLQSKPGGRTHASRKPRKRCFEDCRVESKDAMWCKSRDNSTRIDTKKPMQHYCREPVRSKPSPSWVTRTRTKSARLLLLFGEFCTEEEK
jgi:hypothetical protein